jgi:hypothetical protein
MSLVATCTLCQTYVNQGGTEVRHTNVSGEDSYVTFCASCWKAKYKEDMMCPCSKGTSHTMLDTDIRYVATGSAHECNIVHCMQLSDKSTSYVIVYAKDDGCFFSMTLKKRTKRDQNKLLASNILSTTKNNQSFFSVFVDNVQYEGSTQTKIHEIKAKILLTSTSYKTMHEFDLVLESGTVLDNMYLNVSAGTRLQTLPRSQLPDGRNAAAALKSQIKNASFPSLDPVTRKWGTMIYSVDIKALRSLQNMSSVEAMQRTLDNIITRKRKEGFVEWDSSLQDIDSLGDYMDTWLYVTRFDTIWQCGNNTILLSKLDVGQHQLDDCRSHPQEICDTSIVAQGVHKGQQCKWEEQTSTCKTQKKYAGAVDKRAYGNGYCEAYGNNQASCDSDIIVHDGETIQRCVWDVTERTCYSTTDMERDIRRDRHRGLNITNISSLGTLLEATKNIKKFISLARKYNSDLEDFPDRVFLPIARLNKQIADILLIITTDFNHGKNVSYKRIYLDVPIDVLYITFPETAESHLRDLIQIKNVERNMAAFSVLIDVRESVMDYVTTTSSSNHINVRLVDEFIGSKMKTTLDPLHAKYEQMVKFFEIMFTERQPHTMNQLIHAFESDRGSAMLKKMNTQSGEDKDKDNDKDKDSDDGDYDNDDDDDDDDYVVDVGAVEASDRFLADLMGP